MRNYYFKFRLNLVDYIINERQWYLTLDLCQFFFPVNLALVTWWICAELKHELHSSPLLKSGFMIFGCSLSNNRVIQRPDKSGAELRSLQPVFFSLTALTLSNLFWKFKLHHLDPEATVCAFALNSSYLGLYDLKNAFCQDLINRDLTSCPSLHKVKFFPLSLGILSFLKNLLFYFSQSL